MHLVYTGETVRMASLYSARFICVCISLLLHSHVAKYYTTTAYALRENSKRTDLITSIMCWFSFCVSFLVLTFYWANLMSVCCLLSAVMILLLQSAQTRVQTLNSRVQFNNDVDMSLWCQIDYNGEISNDWVAGSAAQPALPLY